MSQNAIHCRFFNIFTGKRFSFPWKIAGACLTCGICDGLPHVPLGRFWETCSRHILRNSQSVDFEKQSSDFEKQSPGFAISGREVGQLRGKLFFRRVFGMWLTWGKAKCFAEWVKCRAVNWISTDYFWKSADCFWKSTDCFSKYILPWLEKSLLWWRSLHDL